LIARVLREGGRTGESVRGSRCIFPLGFKSVHSSPENGVVLFKKNLLGVVVLFGVCEYVEPTSFLYIYIYILL